MEKPSEEAIEDLRSDIACAIYDHNLGRNETDEKVKELLGSAFQREKTKTFEETREAAAKICERNFRIGCANCHEQDAMKIRAMKEPQ